VDWRSGRVADDQDLRRARRHVYRNHGFAILSTTGRHKNKMDREGQRSVGMDDGGCRLAPVHVSVHLHLHVVSQLLLSCHAFGRPGAVRAHETTHSSGTPAAVMRVRAYGTTH